MPRIKIALAQINCPKGDWAGNLARAGQYMAFARSEGCDLIVFPEMSLSGYCDPAKFPEAVQTLDSPWVGQFLELTARHGIIASSGFIEANPAGKPFITQLLARDGRLLAVYRKAHLGEDEDDLFSPGGETVVVGLEIGGEIVPTGLAVCADSDRPDLFAAMARKGARIVLHSSAPGLYGRRTDETSWQRGFDWYRSHLFERLPSAAHDNDLYIAVATQTGATVDEDFPGGSFVFAPDGACVASVEGYEETMLVCELMTSGRISGQGINSS